jgi:hypothetical protein
MHARRTQPTSLLATIALTIGAVAVGLYAFDWHSHTCEACGTRWRHLGAFNVGDPGSHTCSKCSTVQWWKDGVPHVFRSTLREPPPQVMPDTLVSRLQELGAAPRQALATWPRRGIK